MNRPLRVAAISLLFVSALIAAVPPAAAQSASAVTKLDPNQILGTYYEIARYPIKREKECLDKEMVLYALGDKKRSIQIVTTCQEKAGNSVGWNASGRFSKAGDGRIKLGWIWPFTIKYWFLDLAPDASWALVGNPNHKSLWILSRASTLNPETLVQIQSLATVQGFNTAKLIPIKQAD